MSSPRGRCTGETSTSCVAPTLDHDSESEETVMPQRRGIDSAGLRWLAGQLRWEQILADLRDAQRSGRPVPRRDRPAA
jgi:hypothetical protein